ncbi:MAG: M56 family metallopeptidase [Parasphingorhabdus sp.]|uniref:M56 family metallopeptidase n=1 Tax=Parasphingorhabdus sp. TaxID=2709688 RepID=UPI00329A0016
MTDWMMDTMVSMTLLMLLVLAIRKPVGHFFGAHIAYLLWALPLARLFMPTLTLQAPPPAETAAPALAAPILTDIGLAAPADPAGMAALASIDWMLIALVVWLGGAGMLFISKMASYFQFREDIVSDGHLVGSHGRIRILETAAVTGPLAFGLFEKYIAVPTNFFRDYAPRERELALKHEIAHHESGDLAANFIGLVILSLHWFNPVAWFAWIAFRQDQETACDARVLQDNGRDLRAVYGRTIAKSVSGHKLGLASPLNQKNKIKDRLKMLGQSEKSTMRKRAGALMVGASTVIALPLTATVTYAVEAEAHPHDDALAIAKDQPAQSNPLKIRSGPTTVDVGSTGVVVMEKGSNGYKYTIANDQGRFEFKSERKLSEKQVAKKIAKMQPISQQMDTNWQPVAPKPPVAPIPPAPPEFDGDARDASEETVNITMLNGEKDWAKVRSSGKEHVHRVKYNGRTVVLRTNRKLDKDELREMVAEAEESRKEAEREAREYQREKKLSARERRAAEREVEREVEQALREANREALEAAREARNEVREALREAIEIQREAQEEAREAKSVAARLWEVSQIAFKPNFRVKAVTAKKIKTGSFSPADCAAMNKKIAFAGSNNVNDPKWANVVGCVKVNKKLALEVTLKSLKKQRKKTAECNHKSHQDKLQIEAFDREIKELEAKLSIT